MLSTLLAMAGASVIGGTAGYLTFLGGKLLTGLIGLSPDTGSVVWTLVGAAIFWSLFLPATVVGLRWFRSHDDKTFAYYLMNDYAYTASRRGAYPDEIEARLEGHRSASSTVEARAGQMRRVPRKIMRDPEDEESFVLAQRNPDTGELEPVLRRGARRIVDLLSGEQLPRIC